MVVPPKPHKMIIFSRKNRRLLGTTILGTPHMRKSIWIIKISRFGVKITTNLFSNHPHGNPQPSLLVVITHILGGVKTFIFRHLKSFIHHQISPWWTWFEAPPVPLQSNCRPSPAKRSYVFPVLEVAPNCNIYLLGGFEPTHVKTMLVKMGSSSPKFGVNIKKICELPPPSICIYHILIIQTRRVYHIVMVLFGDEWHLGSPSIVTVHQGKHGLKQHQKQYNNTTISNMLDT